MLDCPEARSLIHWGDFKEASYKKKMLAEIARLPREQVNLIDRFVDDDESCRHLCPGRDAGVALYLFLCSKRRIAPATKRLPVVAFDGGDPGESIRDWGMGPCVAPNDPKALAAGIRRMMESKRYESAKAAAEIA